MAIATSDARNLPIITLLQWGASYSVGGRTWLAKVTMTSGYYANIYCQIISDNSPHEPASEIYSGHYATHWELWYFNTGGDTIVTPMMWQPLSYANKTLPNIVYNFARFVAGKPAAELDLASFTDADTFAIGNGLYFSPVFYGTNVLKIVKEMSEQSAGVYLYTNGQQKLACGYIGKPPVAPDFVIDESDMLAVKAYAEMAERAIPKSVKTRWDCRVIAPMAPRFGAKSDTVEGSDGEVSESEYEAKWVECGSSLFFGSYTDFGDYMKLEVELGIKAYAFDIDSVVQVNHAALGLSIDPSFPDLFRVHKIVYHLGGMTATVTLLKSKAWNSS